MQEDLNLIMNMMAEEMNTAITHLETELAKVRTGRATPQMLDGIHVDYYGVNTPLSQIGNVNTPDARTLVVQPWEKNMLQPIEKAIQGANIGLNPQNDGVVIRINVPALTEERRKDLVKKARSEGEHAKVAIRNHRRDAIEELKAAQKKGTPEDLIKDTEHKVQGVTNQFIEKVDKHLDIKEKEIMTV